MVDVIERKIMFRTLAGNPTARRIAERALEIEDEEEAKERQFPYMGWEWYDIPAQTGTLNQLVIDGLLVTGGRRGTFKSRSTTTYKLKDPELVRECLESLAEIQEGAEEGEIPNDLFDFILGHEDVKDILLRSINSEKPVHILLVGPPATAKSMFLSELARLPFSRFALGGSTRKGGFEDYLLEFRPKYVVIDELDKMDKDKCAGDPVKMKRLYKKLTIFKGDKGDIFKSVTVARSFLRLWRIRINSHL